MVDTETYINQGLKVVKTLISKGDFVTGMKACQELLKADPYNKKAEATLKDIEERILADNIRKVDRDIDATMHLWKEGKFEELIEIYTKLYQYAPDYPRLHKLILNANEKLSGNQKQLRNEFVEKAKEAISGLIKENKYGDAIQACNELIDYAPLDEGAKSLLQSAKTLLVEQKLRENAHISESADFDRAIDFYNSLLAIDPSNLKVKQLKAQVETQVSQQNVLASKVDLNESLARLKEMFDKAEYEQVLQACEEIDRVDPGNLTAKIFKKKAEDTLVLEANSLIVKKLKEVWGALEPEYKKNPTEFVKV